jgi:GNAT superfamily N-acetyltransferase
MQIDLRNQKFELGKLPQNYRFHAWQTRHLSAHADAKYQSFRYELDANVFPCLADSEGCVRLMTEISNRQGFVPEATWLATYCCPETGRRENCATVQGIRDQFDVGAIQNIGVAQVHRGKGIGSIIVQYCLHGFQQVGVNFVTLEVTVQNKGAIRLYERIGFKIQKTVFKVVELPD